MTVINITSFDGLAPKMSPRLLHPSKAQTARNMYLATGKIIPLKGVSAAVYALVAGTKSVYRWGATPSDTQYWLQFQKETSVIQSPVNNDTWSRVYWSTDDGSAAPRYAPSAVAFASSPHPSSSYQLGIPAPSAAPVASSVGTAAVATSSWEYVITFTTSSGDSAPSPSATVTAASARSNFATSPVSISNIQVPQTVAMFTGKKIWARLVGGSTYNLVASIAVAATEFVDNVTTLGAAYSATGLASSQVPTPAYAPQGALESPLVVVDAVAQNYYYAYYRPSYLYQEVWGTNGDLREYTVPEMVSGLSAVASTTVDSSQSVTVTVPAAAYTSRPVVGYPVTSYAIFRQLPTDPEPMLIGMVPIPGSAVTVAFVDSSRDPAIRVSSLARDYTWPSGMTAPTLAATTSTAFRTTSKVTYQYTQTFIQGTTEGRRSDDSSYITVAESAGVRQQGVTLSFSPANAGMLSRIYRRTVVITPSSGTTPSSVSVTNAYKLLVELAAGVSQYSDKRINDLATAGLPAASDLTVAEGPTVAPTLSASTEASPTLQDRAYVYTYVSAYGEEGPPSAVSAMVTVDPDLAVNLTGMSVGPAGAYNITTKRIYRTSAGNVSASFLYVGEIPVANTTYSDVKKTSELGEVLPSRGWTPPEAGLRGLNVGGNGVCGGYINNATADAGGTLCFSEPFMPHAWPPKYQKSVSASIVAMLPFGGNAWGVLTTSFPHVAFGADPASVTVAKLDQPQACVSRQSAVSTGDGVVFASADGLCLLTTGGVQVVTEDLYTRDQWQAMSPSTMRSMIYNNKVIVFISGGSECLIFDFTGKSATLTTAQVGTITGGFYDAVQDTLFLISGNSLVKWDSGSPLSSLWLSKVFEVPKPTSMAWIQVQADSYPVTVRIINEGGPMLRSAGGAEYVYTAVDRSPSRLPSWTKYRDWSLEISGTSSVFAVAIAETAAELSQL